MTTSTTLTMLATALTLLGFAGAAFAQCASKQQTTSAQTTQEPVLIKPKPVGS